MEGMNRARVSACMVLYHAGEEAMKAVDCLAASDLPIDVYLVDNTPEDDTAERIQWKHPGVQVLPQKKNLGFGLGNNQVLHLLRSDYHLLINPDVTFEPDLLSRMVAYMDATPEAAALTPRVFDPDGHEQFLPKEQPTIRYLLGGFLENLGEPFVTWRREYTHRNQSPNTPMGVRFATGCFMLIRTKAFLDLGGFDSRFFLYQEDSDLSRRIIYGDDDKLAPLGKIMYHPDMHITHAWKRENTRTLKGIMRQVISIVKFFSKWGVKW